MSNNHRGLPLLRSNIERTFPKLTSEQIGRMQERGHMRAVKLGEVLVEQGDSNVPFFVVISGEIEILRPSGVALRPLSPYMAQVSLRERLICSLDAGLSSHV